MNEKKLTDEEIVKAILQSIEYSKTITYFDEWGNCKSIMMTDILEFINRLKEGRKTFFRIAKQRNEEKRELQKKIDEQQAEIEELRKAKVIHETVDYCYEYLKDAQAEIERLSKKAVVLEVETNNQKTEIERLTKELEIANGTKNRLTIFDRITIHDKAVKDTAKEIFTELLKEFSIRKSCGNADVVVREMANRKCVEVE